MAPWWGFADQNVLLTVNGELMFVAEVMQSPIDGLAPQDLDVVNRAWQKFLAAVEPPSRAFFVLRRPHEDEPDPLGEPAGLSLADLAQYKRRAHVHARVRQYRTYVVVLYEPQLKRTLAADQAGYIMKNVRRWTRERTRTDHLTVYNRDLLHTAVMLARSHWETIEAMVSPYTPVRLLRAADILHFLHAFVNLDQGTYDAALVARPYGVSWSVVREELAFERKYFRVGRRSAAVYSCCLPPVAAAANCLGDLYAMPIDQTVVMEWRPMERLTAAKRIRSVQRHYQNLRWSWWAGIQQHEGTNLAIEDAAATTQVEQLGAARIELESHGVPYGEATFSCLVAADTPEELDHHGARLSRIFAQLDGKLIRESFAQAAVFFERWAGRPVRPLTRPLFMSSGAVASMAPVFGPPQGQVTCEHLGAPPLAVFETRYATRYFYDLFAGADVGHTLVLGATGSGKSFMLNFLLLQALQYRPRVLVLDLGGSYRWLTRFLGGEYLALDPERTDSGEVQGLRPFSLEPGVRTVHFLTAWVRRLMQLGDFEPDATVLADLSKRIEDVYRLPVDQRTLANLVRTLPQQTWPSLAKFINDGPWARWFDGPPSEVLSFDSDWHVIDLAGAQAHPDWCTAALFFLFERMRIQLESESELSRLKLMVVDEAWRFLADSAVLENLTEAAKTWRKRNAALVLATQSIADISGAGAESLLESLPTRLFLANPDFPETAATVMGLTEAETATIRALEAKREIFLQRSSERAVLQLSVDEESYWLYTSDAVESARRRDMVDRYGLQGALMRLAAGLGTDDQEVQPGQTEVLA